MELTLFVDHQCNLRCSYCYNGEKFSRRMSLKMMRRAVDLALKSATDVLSISFFGGEPLLHADFVQETVKYAERTAADRKPDLRLSYVMNSNAMVFEDDVIALMSPPRRFGVFVSVDGDQAMHDAHRVTPSGRGSYDRVVAGLEKLREAGIPFHILAVLCPDTIRQLGAGLRAIFELGPEKVQFSPNYRDEWTDESIEWLRAGMQDAGDVWMERFRAGSAIAVNPFHTKILSHLKGGMPCPSRCLLGGGEFTVTPTGRLYPCAQMVGEDTDEVVAIGHLDSGIDLKALLRLQKVKDTVEKTCGDCELRDRCQSQCGCRHLALSGKLGVITATLCETEAAFIDEADRIAETLYSEGCEAFIDYYYKRNWNIIRGGKVSPTRVAPEDVK